MIYNVYGAHVTKCCVYIYIYIYSTLNFGTPATVGSNVVVAKDGNIDVTDSESVFDRDYCTKPSFQALSLRAQFLRSEGYGNLVSR